MSKQGLSFEFKCSQKWDKLQLVDGKKICQHCSTMVFDLTGNNKEEIIHLLKKNNNTLCGYFFIDQITEPGSSQKPFNFKIVFAGIVAFFTLSAAKISAQPNDTIKMEQHDNKSPSIKISSDSSLTASNTCITNQYATINERDKKPKKAFMRIGERYFYTSNRFPFITSRRRLMGRFKY